MDHPLKAVSITRKQLAQRLLIARGGTRNQVGVFAGFVGHESTHIPIKCKREPIVSISDDLFLPPAYPPPREHKYASKSRIS